MTRTKRTKQPEGKNLFPPTKAGMSREERIRLIKRIIDKGTYITEEKLEAAIEQLIDEIVY